MLITYAITRILTLITMLFAVMAYALFYSRHPLDTPEFIIATFLLAIMLVISDVLNVVERNRKVAVPAPPKERSWDHCEVCPHGERPEECHACMVASDYAHDAAREDRMFR